MYLDKAKTIFGRLIIMSYSNFTVSNTKNSWKVSLEAIFEVNVHFMKKFLVQPLLNQKKNNDLLLQIKTQFQHENFTLNFF